MPGDSDSEAIIDNADLSVNCIPNCLQLVAEYYSVPRVVPAVAAKIIAGGLAFGNPSLSCDLRNGWDFMCPSKRSCTLKLLHVLPVLFLILSPPCTAFSALNHLWNYPKLPLQERDRRIAIGRVFVSHSMQCAMAQWESGRYFVYEHPASASSWQLDEVKAMSEKPGVSCVVFDQCMCGLVSPIGRIPMRKRTRLMTNSQVMFRVKFQNLMVEMGKGTLARCQHAGCCFQLLSKVVPKYWGDIL